MSSDSDQEGESLQRRLEAKLRKAGIRSESDTEDTSTFCKRRPKPLSKVADEDGSSPILKPKRALKSKKKPIIVDDSDSEGSDISNSCMKRKPKVLNVFSDPGSDSDDSTVFRPQRNTIRKTNVLSGSDEDGSHVGSRESNSDSGQSEYDSGEGSGMFDEEAEEVSGTESGTPDEEGPGDVISSSESEWESDWCSGDEEDEDEEEEEEEKVDNKSPVKESPMKGTMGASGFASDSSDGTSERCPICLARFSDQEVGTPETCDHSFCSDCIQQWAKNINTCPVDRQEFTLVLVRRRVGGKVIARVPVEPRQTQEENQEDPTFCEVCGQSDREDRMLLCDGCDLGFHMECLDPPLEQVPLEEWFCHDCTPNDTTPVADAVDFGVDEVNVLIEESRALGVNHESMPHLRPRVRVLPRTRQLERIRTVIRESMQLRMLAQPSTSSGIDSQNSLDRPPRKRKSTKKMKRKPKTKKKATKRKTNTKKTLTTSASKSPVKTSGKKRKFKRKPVSKAKRRKQTSRRTSRTARVITPQSVKGRLAEQLGLRPPRQPWETLPDVRPVATSTSINVERSRAGIPTLHIFGQRDQLDYFSGSDDEVGNGGDVAVVHQPRATLSLEQRMLNRKRALASLSRPSTTRRAQITVSSTSDGSPIDLVGSILNSQSKMLSKKAEIKVNRDGSLDIQLRETSQPEVAQEQRDVTERLRENHIDVNSAASTVEGRTAQAPMYPGMRGGGGQPGHRPNAYMAARGGGGSVGGGSSGGGRGMGRGGNINSSGFRTSFSNPENTRAQYEQFLGSSGGGRPPPRSQPLRFRLNAPRRPLRRNLMVRRAAIQPEPEEDEEEESQPVKEDENVSKPDEDVDIYSDIEAESRKDGSENEAEPEDSNHEYGALLPPPEPPAILMNLGDQNSDEETSDSELIIDDHAKGPSEEADEDKYDPAEPCDDSEGESAGPITDDIPLPPDEPPSKKETKGDVLSSVVAYSDDSQSQEGLPEEADKEASTSLNSSGNSLVEVEVKQGISEESKEQAARTLHEEPAEPSDTATPTDPASKSDTQMDQPLKADGTLPDDSSEEDEEDDDCPNFSIYSSTSMNIARQAGDESDEDKTKSEAADNVQDVKDLHVAPSTEALEKDEECGDDAEKKGAEDSLLQVDIENSEKAALEESANDRDISEDSSCDGAVDGKPQGTDALVEEIFGLDEDSLVMAPAAPPTAAVAPVMPGLEGLETEIISDGEEAMLDGDLSDDDTLSDDKKRRRKRSRRTPCEDKEKTGEPGEFEDGEIVDEAQREQLRRERREKEKRDKVRKDVQGDENIDISKSKDSADDDKRKKRRRGDRSSRDRAPLSSSENRNKEREKEKERDRERDKEKDKDKDKDRERDRDRDRDKDKDRDRERKKDKDEEKEKNKEDIAWKKPSKSTKDRNYRDGKEKEKESRDKREDERENNRNRKKKEKRKDLERYDVRKVLSDKTLSRQNKDAFGRDLDIRRRSNTRSRSRSNSRARSHPRSPRVRSRSRSHRRAGRSRTRTKSRGKSPGRSRPRHRSASRGSYNRSRNRRSRTRSRSPQRSRHRSLNRSRDTYRKSRSKDKSRKKSRDQKNEPASRPRNRSVSLREAREQPNASANWSRSWSRSWSPSLSGSPQYPVARNAAARSYSRSWSRERVDRVSTTDMAGGKHKTHKNLTVIVTNSKDDTRRKRKDSGKRGAKRRGSPAPSKEVFASGDNILVSVNFSKSSKAGAQPTNAVAAEKGSKRKRDEGRNKRSKKDKSSRTSKSDAQNTEVGKPAEKRRKPPPPEASQKPVAIIDLEQSPYREYTPSPKDLIVLSDSEEDATQAVQQGMEEMNAADDVVDDDQLGTTGPKTPPEPQIKFSISAKNSMRTINNPLMEEEEEEELEEDGIIDERTDAELEKRLGELLHKGPNTPPESPLGPATPGSSPTSPDAYDPFDPTKSRSASPDEGAGNGERTGAATDNLEEPRENGSIGLDAAEDARPKVDGVDDNRISPQKADGDVVSPGTTAPEAYSDEVDKAKQMSPSSSADTTAVAKTLPKVVAASGGSTEVTSTSSSRTASQSQRLLAAVMKGALSARPAVKPSTPVKALPRQNGESAAQTDVVDMDLDSPYSPASSEGDDLFDPPPVYNPKSSKPLPRTKQGGTNATLGAGGGKGDKFDVLFGSSPLRAVKYSNNSRSKPTSKNVGRNQAKLSKLVKQYAKLRKDGGKTDEDHLKILDEVPSSAVEMQVKDKFLKKLNRQERVVEEVKLALKPHYHKKIINKDDYKEILRRSVPKICHTRSGEINPIKIRELVNAYVKKVRYLKKKAAAASGQLKPKMSKKQGD